MLRLFSNSSKGSITVFTTLILIPVVFFTGFFDDLIRIKAYTNMAVMAADSFGEAHLTEYDYLLKETYGLFAISQEKGIIDSKIELYNEMIKWDFDPSGSAKGAINATYNNMYLPKGSFMPMKGVDASLECNVIESANLNNYDVLATQIDDFMKFRIAQVLLEDEDDILKTLDTFKNLEGDSKIVNKKMTYDKEAQELLKTIEDFYNEAKTFQDYTDAVNNLHAAYRTCKNDLKNLATEELERERKAQEEWEKRKKEAEDKGEEFTEEEIDILAMRQEVSGSFTDAIWNYQEALNLFIKVVVGGDDVYAGLAPSNYDAFLSRMNRKLEKVNHAFNSFEQAKNNLNSTVEAYKDKASDGLVKGIDRDIKEYDKMILSESGRKECYKELVVFLEEHKPVIETIRDKAVEGRDKKLYPFTKGFIDNGDDPDYSLFDEELFDIWIWKDYPDANSDVKTLYEHLQKAFEKGNKTEKNQTKSKNLNKIRKDIEKKYNDDEIEDGITKRNINKSFNFGDAKENEDKDTDTHKMVQNTTGYYDSNNSMITDIMTKVFVVSYDMGMFTCRTTNVDANKNGNKGKTIEESLTGIEKKEEVNYLYRAELEYILCGHNSTKKNLDSTRNRILGFRAVLNYVNSYTIAEVDGACRVSEAVPLVGLVLEQASRLLFTSLETYSDWDLLKKGEKVLLYKKTIKDLSCGKSALDFLRGDECDPQGFEIPDAKPNNSTELKLDYKQYLEVMLLFFINRNNVLKRTSNVITMNINNIKQNLPSEQELSSIDIFKMQEAHTAVYSYCSVQSRFAILPKGFAQQVVPNLYGEVVSIEDNVYRFRVTRSY